MLCFATLINYKVCKGYVSWVDPALWVDWIEACYDLLPTECLPPSPNHPAMSPNTPPPVNYTVAQPRIHFGMVPHALAITNNPWDTVDQLPPLVSTSPINLHVSTRVGPSVQP